MSGTPHDPFSQKRIVTVILHRDCGDAIEVDYGTDVSPYEAWGMLQAACDLQEGIAMSLGSEDYEGDE